MTCTALLIGSMSRSVVGSVLASDGPHEAREFARDGNHGLGPEHAPGAQSSEARTQSHLRLPGDRPRGFRAPALALGDGGADAGRESVLPRRLD